METETFFTATIKLLKKTRHAIYFAPVLPRYDRCSATVHSTHGSIELVSTIPRHPLRLLWNRHVMHSHIDFFLSCAMLALSSSEVRVRQVVVLLCVEPG
jgi:hypothetical protein